MNKKINLDEIIKKIWCGTLEKLIPDLCKHKLELFINVLDAGIRNNYTLICSNINEFKVTLDYPAEIWNSVELTEVEMIIENDLYIIQCDLWSSGTLRIKCETIEFIENK